MTPVISSSSVSTTITSSSGTISESATSVSSLIPTTSRTSSVPSTSSVSTTSPLPLEVATSAILVPSTHATFVPEKLANPSIKQTTEQKLHQIRAQTNKRGLGFGVWGLGFGVWGLGLDRKSTRLNSSHSQIS